MEAPTGPSPLVDHPPPERHPEWQVGGGDQGAGPRRGLRGRHHLTPRRKRSYRRQRGGVFRTKANSADAGTLLQAESRRFKMLDMFKRLNGPDMEPFRQVLLSR